MSPLRAAAVCVRVPLRVAVGAVVVAISVTWLCGCPGGDDPPPVQGPQPLAWDADTWDVAAWQ